MSPRNWRKRPKRGTLSPMRSGPASIRRGAWATTLAAALALASRPAGAAPRSPAGPPVGTFTPADADPYFRTGPAAEAAAHLRLEEYAAAAAGFEAYLVRHGKAPDANQAAFLAAFAALKAGQFNPAAERFDALVAKYPLLADHHALYAARAHLGAGRPDDAMARAKLVAADSPLDGEARFLRGDLLRAANKPAEAAAEYRGYVLAFPGSWRLAEARFHLAETLEAAGQIAEAQIEWRRVYLEAPHESWGKQAEAHLTDRTFDAADLAKRAMALFDNQRNRDSELEWAKVLAAPKLTEALTCVARFHLAQSVFKQRDRGRAAPLFEVAADACSVAKDDDLTTKALYQNGRCWASKEDKDREAQTKAAAAFARVWREHGQHSYADDARLREGEAWAALEDEGKVTEAWGGMPEAFPTGDQKGEALWRLAFRAWRRGDFTLAQTFLQKELALLPREEGWWEAGRTLYWLGRISARQGDNHQARTYWARAVTEYPLSYYTLLALNRMRERDRAATEALVRKLTSGAAEPKWTFRPRPLFASPGFKRGLELARLGLGAEARRELAQAGIDVPTKKGTVITDPDQEELLWVAAVVYDRAGEFALSHFIPRHILTTYARSYPVGLDRKKWLLSFPRGFADLIEKNTQLTGAPAALEFAIVREESGFDPLMESFANAIGLTQLTAPPAERFANGLPHDRAALRDPAINVAIGARELGHLWSYYSADAALVIAAYNAGESAVNRWLRDPERAGLQLDEFIEDIPFDETRGYTKRVLGSFLAYVWLADAKQPLQRIPVLPVGLPKPGRKP
jgi:soluble lytic murein transglycosylase